MEALTPAAQRFHEKLGHKLDNPGDACIDWPFTRHRLGYGQFSLGPRGKARVILAHRASLEYKLGREILPGHQACHTCDRKSCVNPNHLYEGTPEQNKQDAVDRGRYHKGTQRYNARFTEKDILDMRHLYDQGVPVQTIADCWGTAYAVAYNIVKRRTWKHLP